MCMPFEFIDGLKDKNGLIFMKHLKNAQSSNIKQIRFIITLEDLIFMIIQQSMTLQMIATYVRSF
jgi:hypothetical protein